MRHSIRSKPLSIAFILSLAAGAPLAAEEEASIADPRAAGAPAADWGAILARPSAPRLPSPLERVEWRTDFWKAQKEAQASGRPIFVTFRCLPCQQCSAFDRDVLEGGLLLDPLLRQFVTVRLTSAEALDRRLFPYEGFQDLDLSWWGYFLGSDARLYGVFGGRDDVSDATRISVAALASTLRRILAWHYDPARPGWGVDRPAPRLEGRRDSPFELPGWKSWEAKYHPKGQTCLHCHQVVEITRQPAIDAGKFDRGRDLDVWPLPENTGIELDRDHGLLVTSARADSPAARAGIAPGDVLGAADGHPLFSQADFRGVLHRGPRGAGAIDLWWLREGKPMRGRLELADGWRKTLLDWRMSVSQGNIGAGPGFFPIAGPERDGRKLAVPYFGPNPKSNAWDAGVRGDQVILSVDGETPPGPGRQFLVWFRLRHGPGDEIELEVEDGGNRRKLRYKLEARAE